MSAGIVKVLSPVLFDSVRYLHVLTQALQILEPFATAHFHVVPGAPSLIDHVSMGYGCRGQRLPTRSGAWPILSRMDLGLQKVSPR